MKLSTFFAALISIAFINTAEAAVVNISATGPNPVEVVDGSLTNVGTTLSLDAGTYLVTPVDANFPGALFTAVLRFPGVSLPNRGYEWNVYLSTDGGHTGVKHGFGEGQPAEDGTYQATAALAFAAAPSPFTFILGTPTEITFYWRDDEFFDNNGGISLDVSAVPVPTAVWLFSSALVGLGYFRRGSKLER